MIGPFNLSDLDVQSQIFSHRVPGPLRHAIPIDESGAQPRAHERSGNVGVGHGTRSNSCVPTAAPPIVRKWNGLPSVAPASTTKPRGSSVQVPLTVLGVPR